MDISEAAREYAANGWVLVEFPAGTKGPRHYGWNQPEKLTYEPDEAALFTGNIGLCHAASRTCCLDIDDADSANSWLAARNLRLESFRLQPDRVEISSGREGRAKLLYRLPEGLEPLPSKRPAGSGLELRCATEAGLTVQDVLPPSIHPITKKPYVWEYGCDLTGHWSSLPELPPELLSLWKSLLTPETKEKSSPQGVEANRLRGMLTRVDPDLEYNEWIKVGMALHHETEGEEYGLQLWDEWSSKGSKYKGDNDCEAHWRSFGKTKGRQTTVNSLIAMAGGVSADDFDDLDAIPEQPKRQRFEIVPAHAFAAGPPPEWIIKGVLAKAGLGVGYGESGAGKSFAFIDMLAAITRGHQWNGRRTISGRGVYVAAEGVGGVRKRLQAYSRHYDVDLAALPFGVITDVPNLLKEDHKLLAERVNAWGGADVIMVDTYAQVTPGADENSSEDMGRAIAHCQQLHKLTGAMVFLIHHAGKDAARGARGWSGIKGAADSEIAVTIDEHGRRKLRISKQKDGEDGLAFGFSLKEVHLGTDADGDPVTSCVVDWHEFGSEGGFRVRPRGLWQQVVLDVALHLGDLCEGLVPVDTVLTKAAESQPHDPLKRDRRRNMANRALGELCEAGWLAISGDNVAIQPVSAG